MTDAIKALRDYLSKSPSVVYPQDVLEYLPAIEAEKAKLLELVADMWNDMSVCYEQYVRISSSDMRFYGDRMRELGIEVEP